MSMHPDDFDPGPDLSIDNEAAVLYRRACDLADRLGAAGLLGMSDAVATAATLLGGVMAATFEHPAFDPDTEALT